MNTKPAQVDSVRLTTVLDLLHITGNKLSKILGYKSAASVYHVLENRNNLSPAMIEGIIKEFPEISYTFLKTGQGQPRLSTDADRQSQRNLFRHVYKDEQPDSDINEDPIDKILRESSGESSNSSSYGMFQQMEVLINNSSRLNTLVATLIEENRLLRKNLEDKS